MKDAKELEVVMMRAYRILVTAILLFAALVVPAGIGWILFKLADWAGYALVVAAYFLLCGWWLSDGGTRMPLEGPKSRGPKV